MRAVGYLMIGLALGLGACASYEPSSSPVAERAELKFAADRGVRVGAQPYTDRDLQAATFDADFDESDVVAIQVMVENQSGARVLVRSSDARLEMPNGKSIAPSGVSRTVGRIDEDGSVVGAGIAFGIIGVMVASGEEDKAKQARRIDYEAKSLGTVELLSGEAKDGFVFFLPPRTAPAFDSALLKVRFIDPALGESWWVELPLSGISYEPTLED